MGKIILDIAISLDGHITSIHHDALTTIANGELPKERWLFNDQPASEIEAFNIERESIFTAFGASVISEQTYQKLNHIPNIKGFDRPTFVICRDDELVDAEKDANIIFVDSIETGLGEARKAARDQPIGLANANIAKHCIEKGMLDEIHTHIISTLAGNGPRLFDELTSNHKITLTATKITTTPYVIHHQYKVK